jgi:hypothetical protein
MPKPEENNNHPLTLKSGQAYSIDDLEANGVVFKTKEEDDFNQDLVSQIREKGIPLDEIIESGADVKVKPLTDFGQVYKYGSQITPLIAKKREIDNQIDRYQNVNDDEKQYLKWAAYTFDSEDYIQTAKVMQGLDPKQQDDTMFSRFMEGLVTGATTTGVATGLASSFGPVGAAGVGIAAAAGGLYGGIKGAATDQKRYYFDADGKAIALGVGELPPPGAKIESTFGNQLSADDDNPATTLGKSIYNSFVNVGKTVPEVANLFYGLTTGEDSSWMKDFIAHVDNMKFDTHEDASKSVFGVGEDGDVEFTPNPQNMVRLMGDVVGSLAQFIGGAGVARAISGSGKAAQAGDEIAALTAKPASIAQKLVANSPFKNKESWLVSSMISLSEASEAARQAGIKGRAGYAFTAATAIGVGAMEIMIGGQELRLLNKRKIFKDVAEDMATKRKSVKTALKEQLTIGVDVPNPTSMNGLFNATIKHTALNLALYGKNAVKEAVGEGIEEGSQTLFSQYMQVMYDNMGHDGNKYGTVMMGKKEQAELYESILGGFMGGAFGGTVSPQRERSQNEEIYRHIETGNEALLESQLKKVHDQGRLTDEQYNNAVNKIRFYKQYHDEIKKDDLKIQTEDKAEFFEALWNQNSAKAKVEELSANEVANPYTSAKIKAYEDQVKHWQKKIDGIVAKATKPTEEKKEESKSEEQAVSSEAETKGPVTTSETPAATSEVIKEGEPEEKPFTISDDLTFEVKGEDEEAKKAVRKEELVRAKNLQEIKVTEAENTRKKVLEGIKRHAEKRQQEGTPISNEDYEAEIKRVSDIQQRKVQDEKDVLDQINAELNDEKPAPKQTKEDDINDRKKLARDTAEVKIAKLKKDYDEGAISVFAHDEELEKIQKERDSKIEEIEKETDDTEVTHMTKQHRAARLFDPKKHKTSLSQVSKKLNTKEKILKFFGINKTAKPDPSLNLEIPSKETVKKAPLKIVNGMLEIPGGEIKVTDKEGNTTLTLAHSKSLPVYKLTDKHGNNYLFATSDIVDSQGEFIPERTKKPVQKKLGLSYLYLLNNKGEVTNSKVFYNQRHEQKSGAFISDDLAYFKNQLGLKLQENETEKKEDKAEPVVPQEKKEAKIISEPKKKNFKERKEKLKNKYLNVLSQTDHVKIYHKNVAFGAYWNSEKLIFKNFKSGYVYDKGSLYNTLKEIYEIEAIKNIAWAKYDESYQFERPENSSHEASAESTIKSPNLIDWIIGYLNIKKEQENVESGRKTGLDFYLAENAPAFSILSFQRHGDLNYIRDMSPIEFSEFKKRWVLEKNLKKSDLVILKSESEKYSSVKEKLIDKYGSKKVDNSNIDLFEDENLEVKYPEYTIDYLIRFIFDNPSRKATDSLSNNHDNYGAAKIISDQIYTKYGIELTKQLANEAIREQKRISRIRHEFYSEEQEGGNSEQSILGELSPEEAGYQENNIGDFDFSHMPKNEPEKTEVSEDPFKITPDTEFKAEKPSEEEQNDPFLNKINAERKKVSDSLAKNIKKSRGDLGFFYNPQAVIKIVGLATWKALLDLTYNLYLKGLRILKSKNIEITEERRLELADDAIDRVIIEAKKLHREETGKELTIGEEADLTISLKALYGSKTEIRNPIIAEYVNNDPVLQARWSDEIEAAKMANLSDSEDRFAENEKKLYGLFINSNTSLPYVGEYTRNELMEMAEDLVDQMPDDEIDVKQYFIDFFPVREMAEVWRNGDQDDFHFNRFVRLRNHYKSSQRFVNLLYINSNEGPFVPLQSNARYTKPQIKRENRESLAKKLASISITEIRSILQNNDEKKVKILIALDKFIREENKDLIELLKKEFGANAKTHFNWQYVISKLNKKSDVTGIDWAAKKEDLIDALTRSSFVADLINADIETAKRITGIDQHKNRGQWEAFLRYYSKKEGFETYERFLANRIINGQSFGGKTAFPTADNATEISYHQLRRIRALTSTKAIKDYYEGVGEKGSQLDTISRHFAEYSVNLGVAKRFTTATGKNQDSTEYDSFLTNQGKRAKREDIRKLYKDNPWFQKFKDSIKFFKLDGVKNTDTNIAEERSKLNSTDFDIMLIANFMHSDKEHMAGKGNYLFTMDQQADSSTKIMIPVERLRNLTTAQKDSIRKLHAKRNKTTAKQSSEAINKEVGMWQKKIENFVAKKFMTDPGVSSREFAEEFVYNHIYNKYHTDQYFRGKNDRELSYAMSIKRKIHGMGLTLLQGLPGGIGKTHRVMIVNDPKVFIDIGVWNKEVELPDGGDIMMPWFNDQIEISSGGMYSGVIKAFTYTHINGSEHLIKANDVVYPHLHTEEGKIFYAQNPMAKKIVEYAKEHGIDRIAFKSGTKITGEENVNDWKWTTSGPDIKEVDFGKEAPKYIDIENDDFRVILDLTNEGLLNLGSLPTQILNILKSTKHKAAIDKLFSEASLIKEKEIQEVLNKSGEDIIKWLMTINPKSDDVMALKEMNKQSVITMQDPIVRGIVNKYWKNAVRKKLLDFVVLKAQYVHGKVIGQNLGHIKLDKEKNEVQSPVVYLPASAMKSDENPNGFEEGEGLFIIRVPTGDLNSFSYVKVAGFLPPTMKNTIVTDGAIQVYSGSDHDGDTVFLWAPYKNKAGKEVPAGDSSYESRMNSIFEMMKETYEDPHMFNRITEQTTIAEKKEYLETYYDEGKNLDPLMPSSWNKMVRANLDSQDVISITASALKVVYNLASNDINLSTQIRFPKFNTESRTWEKIPFLLTGWGRTVDKDTINSFEFKGKNYYVEIEKNQEDESEYFYYNEDNKLVKDEALVRQLGRAHTEEKNRLESREKEKLFSVLNAHLNHAADAVKNGTLSMMNKFSSTAGQYDALLGLDAEIEDSLTAFMHTPGMKKFIELYEHFTSVSNRRNGDDVYDKIVLAMISPKTMGESLTEEQKEFYSNAWVLQKNRLPDLYDYDMESDSITSQIKIVRMFSAMNKLSSEIQMINKILKLTTSGPLSYGEYMEGKHAYDRIMFPKEGSRPLRFINHSQVQEMINSDSFVRAKINRAISGSYYATHPISTNFGQHVIYRIAKELSLIDNPYNEEGWKERIRNLKKDQYDLIYNEFDKFLMLQAMNVTESKESLKDDVAQWLEKFPEDSFVKKYLTFSLVNERVELSEEAKQNVDDFGYSKIAKDKMKELPDSDLNMLIKYLVSEFGWRSAPWSGSFYEILPYKTLKDVKTKLEGLSFLNSTNGATSVSRDILINNPELIPEFDTLYAGVVINGKDIPSSRKYVVKNKAGENINELPYFVKIKDENRKGKYNIFERKKETIQYKWNSVDIFYYEKDKSVNLSNEVMRASPFLNRPASNEMASRKGIPVINMADPNWEAQLNAILNLPPPPTTGQSQIDFPEDTIGPKNLNEDPITSADPKQIEIMRKKFAKLFPHVKAFSAEEFQRVIDVIAPGKKLDMNAWGASIGDAYWINPNTPHQEAIFHEHAHIYWAMLPDSDIVKKKLLAHYGSEEAAVNAIGKAGTELVKLESQNKGLFNKVSNWMKHFWSRVRAMIWKDASPDLYAKIMAQRMWKGTDAELAQQDFRNLTLNYMKRTNTGPVFQDHQEKIDDLIKKINEKRENKIKSLSEIEHTDITRNAFSEIIRRGAQNFWQAAIERITGKQIQLADSKEFEIMAAGFTPIPGNNDYVYNEQFARVPYAGAMEPGFQMIRPIDKDTFSKDRVGIRYIDLIQNDENENLAKKVTKEYQEYLSDMIESAKLLSNRYTDESKLELLDKDAAVDIANDLSRLKAKYNSRGMNMKSDSLAYFDTVDTIITSYATAHLFTQEIKNEVDSKNDKNRVFIKALHEIFDPRDVKDLTTHNSWVGKDNVIAPFAAHLKSGSAAVALRNQIIQRAEFEANNAQAEIKHLLSPIYKKLKDLKVTKKEMTDMDTNTSVFYFVHPSGPGYPASENYQKLKGKTDEKSKAIIEFADTYASLLNNYAPKEVIATGEKMFQVNYAEATGTELSKKLGWFTAFMHQFFGQSKYDRLHIMVPEFDEPVTLKNYKRTLKERQKIGGADKKSKRQYYLALRKATETARKMYDSTSPMDAANEPIIRTDAKSMFHSLYKEDSGTRSRDIFTPAMHFLHQGAFVRALGDNLLVMEFTENYATTYNAKGKNVARFIKQLNDWQLYGIKPESKLPHNVEIVTKFLIEYTGLKFMALNFGAATMNLFGGITQNVRDLGFRKTFIGVMRTFGSVKPGTNWKTAFLDSKIVNIMQQQRILEINHDWTTADSSDNYGFIKQLLFSPTAFVEFFNHSMTIAGSMSQKQWDAYKHDGTVKDGHKGMTADQIIKLISEAQDIHGSYHRLAKRIAASTTEGRAIMQLRTWMFDIYDVHAMSERFAGTSDKKLKGIVRTVGDIGGGTFKYLEVLAKEKDHEKAKKMFYALKPVDQENLRKLAREATMMLLISMLIAGFGDDDKETYTSLNRMWGDVAVVYDIDNYIYTFQGGLPVFSTIVDALKMMKGLAENGFYGPLVYEKDTKYGKKGDSKVPMMVVNTLPMEKVIKKFMEEK